MPTVDKKQPGGRRVCAICSLSSPVLGLPTMLQLRGPSGERFNQIAEAAGPTALQRLRG